jgi:sodium/pantothenate symporter
MELANQLLIGFGLMVVLSVMLGSVGRRRNTSSLLTFFWGDNQLRPRSGIHLLLSGPFSMNGILYQTWLGYQIGWAAVLLQVIWCGSYLLMAAQGEKISKLARSGTLHGNIGRVFGPRAELWAAIASILGFTLQIGWELIVGVSIFSAISPDNVSLQTALIITLAVISAVYTMLGGLRGNAKANEVQNWWAGLALWAVVLFLLLAWTNHGPDSGNRPFDLGGSLPSLITVLGIGGFITNAIFSLSWQFVDMSTWQNIGATEDRNNASKRVLNWTALLVFIFPGVVGTLAGMGLRSVPGLDAGNIVSYLVGILSAYPFFSILIAAGFVAAMLSTIDGLLLATSQAMVWDITHRRAISAILKARTPNALGVRTIQPSAEDTKLVAVSDEGRQSGEESDQTNETERKLLDVTRYFILAFALAGGGLIFWFTVKFKISIFDLVYIVVLAQMVLLPVVISVLWDPEAKRNFGTASIIAGLLTGIALVAYGIVTKSASLLSWTPAIAMGVSFLIWLPSLKRRVESK